MAVKYRYYHTTTFTMTLGCYGISIKFMGTSTITFSNGEDEFRVDYMRTNSHWSGYNNVLWI